MGLKSCSRKGCESIMCDTYVDGVGYVCDHCQLEFERHLKKVGIEVLTRGEISVELERFIEETRREYLDSEKVSVADFFKTYTEGRNYEIDG